MAEIKALLDEYGVIHSACKKLPDEQHRVQFLYALAELEDNECHRTRKFPVTRLHKVTGIKQAVYRADVDKISGWRIHLQYASDGVLHLKDLVPGSKHDNVIEVIKSKKDRYQRWSTGTPELIACELDRLMSRNLELPPTAPTKSARPPANSRSKRFGDWSRQFRRPNIARYFLSE
jgi:hypothetical protein